MSRLQQRLDRIKAGFAERAPAEAKAVMHQATEELRSSGIMDSIPQVGDPLPPFELPGEEGIVSSQELLGAGPLVISFYRGGW